MGSHNSKILDKISVSLLQNVDNLAPSSSRMNKKKQGVTAAKA
jgi:hypothetical protein